jgi:hypothetical protein
MDKVTNEMNERGLLKLNWWYFRLGNRAYRELKDREERATKLRSMVMAMTMEKELMVGYTYGAQSSFWVYSC